MPHTQISFKSVPLESRPTTAIMLAVLEETEQNKAHLTKHLGERTASMVLEAA